MFHVNRKHSKRTCNEEILRATMYARGIDKLFWQLDWRKKHVKTNVRTLFR